VTEPTIHPADQTAQRGTSPGKKCHYLVCHGEVQTGKIAFLDGAAVGVYTEIGDPLTWQDARNILKMRLDPIYRPVQGEFPEYKLSAFAQHERETWEKYAKVEFDAPDTEFLEEDQTLSSYLGVFSQSGHERELRLLACAGLSEPTSVARKLFEPASWSKKATVSDTNGRLFDLRNAENAQESSLLQACASSWDDAQRILTETNEDLTSAYALKGGPSTLAVKTWEAWQKKPAEQDHIVDWLEFLEILTPNKAIAQDLHKSWQDAHDVYPSLARALGEACNPRNLRKTRTTAKFSYSATPGSLHSSSFHVPSRARGDTVT
jgi:hypothetical protein